MSYRIIINEDTYNAAEMATRLREIADKLDKGIIDSNNPSFELVEYFQVHEKIFDDIFDDKIMNEVRNKEDADYLIDKLSHTINTHLKYCQSPRKSRKKVS